MTPRLPSQGLLGGALLLLAGTAFSATPAAAPDPDPEALEELAAGRYWHASRILEGDEDVSPLLRARGEAGWGNWPAAWRLLERVDAVPPLERASAWALRGRAAEEVGRPTEAALSYRRALDASPELHSDSALVARIRLARTSDASGRGDRALAELDALAAEAPWAASWLGVELARSAARSGDVSGTRRALAVVRDPAARRASWDLFPRAHLAAGDTAAALDAYLGVVRSSDEPEVRGAAWSRIGRLRLERGETASARQALAHAVELAADPRGARLLLGLGLRTEDEAGDVYRILRRSGEPADALSALRAYGELTEGSLPDEMRLERARLLYREDRLQEASSELEELSGLENGEVAAPALDLLSALRRRQGLAGEARSLQEMLVRRFPSHPDAVDVVFFRGDASHDRQDWTNALGYYGRAAEMSPTLSRAGLARMRMGQIHLTRGSPEEAAEIFEGYLESFPEGRRWDEARYWAAWTRSFLGDDAAAREHARHILERDPLSYYAVLALRLLDREFAPDLPEGTPPPDLPAVHEELDRIEILESAGLDDAVPHAVDALVERHEGSDDELLRVSVELSDRGFTMEGISLGWRVQSRGHPWDRWLARAVYPFPYRDLVRREAEEWELDPFYLAALIRQESAFLAEARSSAGALGLMQVIPSTGESLARRVGPDRFTEELLLRPEVNLHLGAAFLSRLHDRFGDRLPLVLAAYNAGPSRADRWEASFPERADLERFTERIPYEETRGYVKAVTRNTEIYRWLYGPAG